MNLKTSPYFFLVCLLLSLPLVPESSPAQSSPAAAPSPAKALPGSKYKMEEVVTKASAIFVANITKNLPILLGPPDSAIIRLQVDVSRTLKGTVASSLIVPAFAVSKDQEDAPPVGSQHIFFIEQKESYILATKIIPATDDNIAKVTQLIAADNAH